MHRDPSPAYRLAGPLASRVEMDEWDSYRTLTTRSLSKTNLNLLVVAFFVGGVLRVRLLVLWFKESLKESYHFQWGDPSV